MTTSSIRGSAINDLCRQYASMLNFDIYDTAAGDVPSEIHPYLQLNTAHWDKAWENDDPDGYRSCFYTPKNAGDDPTGVCPPVLVFRGSDTAATEMAELALGLRVQGRVTADFPNIWGAPDDIVIPFDVDQSFSVGPELKGKKMAELEAMPLDSEALFTNESGREEIILDLPLWLTADVALEWTISAKVFFGPNGDWPTNFAQGLGRTTSQYTKAIRDGRRAAAEAAQRWGNRIVVTGHSLGGGLASAASLAIRADHPDMVMKCDTYNAAGLHANTARSAGSTLSQGGAVPVLARHIKDEILNSMQATTRVVPFLSALLAWGGKVMPPAIANPTSFRGVSPGPMAVFHQNLAPKGDPLPILFPVDHPQSMGSSMTVLNRIIGFANAAPTVQRFMADTVDFIEGQLSMGTQITSGEAQELQAALETNPLDFAAIGAEVLAAIETGAQVTPISLGTSNYMTRRVNPFINGMINDAVTLARIMIASGNYHTYVPCAFTFNLPRS